MPALLKFDLTTGPRGLIDGKSGVRKIVLRHESRTLLVVMEAPPSHGSRVLWPRSSSSSLLLIVHTLLCILVIFVGIAQKRAVSYFPSNSRLPDLP
jgi:hypothetical protein